MPATFFVYYFYLLKYYLFIYFYRVFINKFTYISNNKIMCKVIYIHLPLKAKRLDATSKINL